MAKRKHLYYEALIGRREGTIHEAGLQKRICGHPSIVARLQLDKKLKGHQGCVNTVCFSPDGTLCITGSDDTRLMVWDVASGDRKLTYQSPHTNNIFCARFLPFTDNDEVVSCAADGQVRSFVLSRQSSRLLHRHNGRAHRLCLEPGSSRAFLSCGEDGLVFRYDLRQSERRRLMTLRDEDGDVLPCYAMSVDPIRPVNFILGGTSTFVQLFDARNPSSPVARFCPLHLRRGRQDHVTGTAFDWTGKEFVATYNDEHVYRFHVDKDAVVEDEGAAGGAGGREGREKKRAVGTRATPDAAALGEAAAAAGGGGGAAADADTEEDDRKEAGEREDGEEKEDEGEEKLGYRRKYTGHRNDQTVKQVNFFGPRSEFVVSGSDCGHIFLWAKASGRLVQLLYGDAIGAVNCLEPHPTLPILATSGLEHDAKIWRPTRDGMARELTGKDGRSAEQVMRRNDRLRSQPRAQLVPFTSMLMRRAMASDNPDDIRSVLAILSAIGGRGVLSMGAGDGEGQELEVQLGSDTEEEGEEGDEEEDEEGSEEDEEDEEEGEEGAEEEEDDDDDEEEEEEEEEEEDHDETDYPVGVAMPVIQADLRRDGTARGTQAQAQAPAEDEA